MKLSSFAVKALAVSVLLASSASVALAGGNYKGERNFKGEAPCPPPLFLRDGFYLGAQGGYDSYHVREDYAAGFANPPIAADGGVGGLFIGYGMNVSDMFYVGGELFGNYSGVDTSYHVGDAASGVYTDNFKAQWSWGVSVLPGIKFNPAMLLYARLGYEWADLKANQSFAFDGTTASASSSNNSGGFNWGVGVETEVMDNWSVRVEYNRTEYDNFTVNHTGTKYKPTDNQFMGSIIWHMGNFWA